jgi:all-trans-retinol dehydrogenase (NAD+)
VNGKALTSLSPAEVRRTFDVNTLAHFWMLQATLPSLEQCADALIVTISSVVKWALSPVFKSF